MKKKLNKKQKKALLDIATKKWLEENKDMWQDYYDICHDILMFKAMWGINIGIILKDPEVIEGRKLKFDGAEELF